LEAVDIVSIVESSLGLYSNKLKNKSVTVEKKFEPCPAFAGSAGELKQVVANLISNAIDAVGSHGRLKLAVSSFSRLDQEWVEFRIEDDGPGIATEHMSKIFEPFFTTKTDVGTGLGLWVARQIVERHGGTLEAYSGQTDGLSGATFIVRLSVSRLDAQISA
jgi:signal transduction histidine kinase